MNEGGSVDVFSTGGIIVAIRSADCLFWRVRKMSKTSSPLKNLRGVLLILIVAFHSFSAYIVTQPTTPPAFDLPPYDWRVFPIIDNERWLGFDLFCAFQFLYLMQFMFFLSGLFVWPSLQRKGWKGFLAHRLVRLGIPFVIGVYLVMPIAFYPVYRVTAVDPSWSSFWAHWTALPITPTGPMWFLWFLIALDFCAAAIFKLTSGGGGFVAGSQGLDRGIFDEEGTLVRRWPLWTGGAFAAFFLWIIPAALIAKMPNVPVKALSVIGDLGLVIFAAAACLSMTGLFQRFARGRLPVIGDISEHGYGVYFFHYPILLWLQYALLDQAMPAVAKGMLVLTGTVFASWGASVLTDRVLTACRPVFTRGVGLLGAELGTNGRFGVSKLFD
jgi:peptidoglycan/LPS O-acetylase OafA/YrhL